MFEVRENGSGKEEELEETVSKQSLYWYIFTDGSDLMYLHLAD